MATKYILSNIPYNLSDIPLASLVPNKSQPNQDAFIPVTELKELTDFDWRNRENFTFSRDQRNEADIAAWLTKFLALRGRHAAENHGRLWSKEGRVYELKQPRDLFITMCKDQAARQWLEARYNAKESVYMVVGFRTFLDARSIREDEEMREMAVKGNIPMGQIASQGIPVDSGSLDVQLAARRARWRRIAESFRIKGERIFAISFRKVRYDWFAGGNADKARLAADNQWTVTLLSTDENAAQVVQVDLKDEFDVVILEESPVDDLDNFEENEAGVGDTKEKELQFQAAKVEGENGAEFYLRRLEETS